jgi:hypothetical protein
MMLANGEELPDRAPDAPAPLSLLTDADVTLGMMIDEHADGCPNRLTRMREAECDCETDPFSSRACEGCGSHLAGERNAVTIWEK